MEQNDYSKGITGVETVAIGGIPAYSYEKGKQLEILYKIAIGGIIVSIIFLSIDIYRDNSLHSRITELEKDVADYKVELNKEIDNLPKEERVKIIENDIKNLQKSLNCLKNKEYFSMKCF